MSDTQDAVVISDTYKESDEHVPDPTDAFGTLDTSATAGSAHGQVDAVTPIFKVAKTQEAIVAAKALDPNDDSVDASMVVLPQGMVIAEDGAQAARDRVLAAGESAASNPVEVGGPNPYQEAAAESGDGAAAKAQAEQQDSGAGSTQTSTDTARQTNEPVKSTTKPATK